MILGLDISSSITGIAIVKDGKTVHSTICDTRNKTKFPHPNVSGAKFKAILEGLKGHDITHIYAEQRLLSFRPGFSSAKTLATLSAYNCLYCYLAEEVLGLRPIMIGASTARKLTGVNAFKDSEKTTKQWVIEAVESILSDFSFELTHKGNPKPGTSDRADALVVALAGEILCTKENSQSSNKS